jgi:hypothetical protein
MTPGSFMDAMERPFFSLYFENPKGKRNFKNHIGQQNRPNSLIQMMMKMIKKRCISCHDIGNSVFFAEATFSFQYMNMDFQNT